METVKQDDAGGGAAAEVVEPSATPAGGTPATEPAKEGEGAPATETKGKIKLPASFKPPAKTGRFQTRISDLVNQRDTAQSEARQLREQLSKMARPPGATRGGAEATGETDPNAALNPEDFATYAEYVQALVERTMDQKSAASQSQRAEKAYEDYRQEKLTEFNTNAGELAEVYGEGFWDAITDNNLPVSEAMADAVMELGKMAPYTMLWLAGHRDKALEIARMNPRQATIAIGRLAAHLDSELKAENTSPTAAGGEAVSATPGSPAAPGPTPVPTPRGSAPTGTAMPGDKDSVDEWLKKETDRLRRINPNARFYGAR